MDGLFRIPGDAAAVKLLFPSVHNEVGKGCEDFWCGVSPSPNLNPGSCGDMGGWMGAFGYGCMGGCMCAYGCECMVDVWLGLSPLL